MKIELITKIFQISFYLQGPTAVPSFTGILNSIPYPGCAAALKCVPEDYCTVEGVISDVPIVLTKDFLLLRVALSVRVQVFLIYYRL